MGERGGGVRTAGWLLLSSPWGTLSLALGLLSDECLFLLAEG